MRARERQWEPKRAIKSQWLPERGAIVSQRELERAGERAEEGQKAGRNDPERAMECQRGPGSSMRQISLAHPGSLWLAVWLYLAPSDSLACSLALSGSNWPSVWPTLALTCSLCLSVAYTLASTDSLCHSLAHNCSEILLIWYLLGSQGPLARLSHLFKFQLSQSPPFVIIQLQNRFSNFFGIWTFCHLSKEQLYQGWNMPIV